MEILSPDKLPVGEPLNEDLYHRTGLLLFREGKVLKEEHVQALLESGVDSVYMGADPSELAQNEIKVINVEDVPLDESLEDSLMDEHGGVLLGKGQVFKAHHRDALIRRGQNQVRIFKREALKEVEKFEDELTRGLTESIDRDVEETADLVVESSGPPFLGRVSRKLDRSQQEKKDAVNHRERGHANAKKLLEQLAGGARQVDVDVIGMVQDTVTAFSRDSHMHLHMAGMTIDPDDPRPDHLVNVCTTAISIGTFLGYSEMQIQELGLCAFVHDIGISQIPREIIMKPGKLNPQELLEIQRHPILGVNMLEKIPGVPSLAPLVVYQTHERPSGTGYPKGRVGRFIHDYAKIISVADAYAALRAPRPHREAKLPYQAMEAVVRMAAGKDLDVRMVRALLQSLGLYPVGSWVQLNSGEIARVVGTSKKKDRFDRPVVTLIYDKNGDQLKQFTTYDLTKQDTVKVVRALPPDEYEKDPMIGF